LDALQHCLPQNLRQFLNHLPETLDETYDRILKGINKAQKDDAHRLLQCLAVAVRPLRVEELAEVLAFDFQGLREGEVPKLKEDWRWENHEEAILSTCSSLITIVREGDSQIVQFSHFSVKEYLTSSRLARSHEDASQFYIHLEPAHTILARACLGTLLLLDEHAVSSGAKGFPLAEYAARHWVDHARFEKVSSHVWDGIDDLFDASKPHFQAWLHVYDIDKNKRWGMFKPLQNTVGSPLYYAALCGFYDLAERLIVKHPEQVNAVGGHILAPLPAALHEKHFRVADLLHKHGAVMDVRAHWQWTPLHSATQSERLDIMQWLFDHGTNVEVRAMNGWTPLHVAVRYGKLESVRMLLEPNADINSRDNKGKTPLHGALFYLSFFETGKTAAAMRRLLEYGADANVYDHNHSTPLHRASSKGWLKIARLLLSHGANVDEKDNDGRTPFELASSNGNDEMMILLLEHGAKSEPSHGS